MMNVRITVNGLPEVGNMLANVGKGFNDAKRQSIKEMGTLMVTQAKNNAHVITGRMQGSINIQSLTDNQAIIMASAPYSSYENKRFGEKSGSGPHNFWDRAVDTVEKESMNIVKRNYENVINRSKA